MQYKSTRNKNNIKTSRKALLQGIAEDGGLFVPEEFPDFSKKLKELLPLSYQDLAFEILKVFFADFEEDALKASIQQAYDEKFHRKEIAPLVKKKNLFFLELFHGPTLAFKDMALSILPFLLQLALKKEEKIEELVILTATSGDTGKAALEGFSNRENIKIIVFYPINGVSPIQKRQMITHEGENVLVVGIEGNFDDAQRGLKSLFNDPLLKEELSHNDLSLSSANSINIGRLIPQIVYYFHGYFSMVQRGEISLGEKINVVVPTGNFGNILAAYYSKKMGLPINKLICASNDNNVLSDFFKEGVYDRKRDFKTTNSPSMDILVSSNLERLLFHISGEEDHTVDALMEDLNTKEKYEINASMKEGLEDFWGGYAKEEEVLEGISKVYKASSYLMDTHTSVAYCVYEKYKEKTGDSTKSLIVSTASPYKFAKSVGNALDLKTDSLDDFHVIENLSSMAKLEIPLSIKELKEKQVLHKKVCKKESMETVVKNFLGV